MFFFVLNNIKVWHWILRNGSIYSTHISSQGYLACHIYLSLDTVTLVIFLSTYFESASLWPCFTHVQSQPSGSVLGVFLVQVWHKTLCLDCFLVLYIDLRPGQTCHSKVMHRKEVTHSKGSYEKKSCRRAWLKKWDKVKIPWYTHRLMHWKRVTCELHDSYFRLMTIKHAIPKIEWAIELLYNSEDRKSGVGDQMSWRQDVVGKATTQQKGPSGLPMELEIRWVRDKMQ